MPVASRLCLESVRDWWDTVQMDDDFWRGLLTSLQGLLRVLEQQQAKVSRMGWPDSFGLAESRAKISGHIEWVEQQLAA